MLVMRCDDSDRKTFKFLKFCEHLQFSSTVEGGNFSPNQMHTFLNSFSKAFPPGILWYDLADLFRLMSTPFSSLGFQWLFGGHSPSIGLTPSSTVELVPVFPHVCPAALPPPVGKSWIDKRIPNCKVKCKQFN